MIGMSAHPQHEARNPRLRTALRMLATVERQTRAAGRDEPWAISSDQ